ncbi:hypothetical protein BHM03_00043440, partial [Ensete ventricosum]
VSEELASGLGLWTVRARRVRWPSGRASRLPPRHPTAAPSASDTRTKRAVGVMRFAPPPFRASNSCTAMSSPSRFKVTIDQLTHRLIDPSISVAI